MEEATCYIGGNIKIDLEKVGCGLEEASHMVL